MNELKKLRDELDTLRWSGSDVGWDLAIEKVRERVTAMIADEMMRTKEKQASLIKPLLDHLLPISNRMNAEAVPQKGRTISLPRSDWKKQYEKGINHCIGFDILWT